MKALYRKNGVLYLTEIESVRVSETSVKVFGVLGGGASVIDCSPEHAEKVLEMAIRQPGLDVNLLDPSIAPRERVRDSSDRKDSQIVRNGLSESLGTPGGRSRMIGELNYWDTSKGFGFIRDEVDNLSWFVHISDTCVGIQNEIMSWEDGDWITVEFSPGEKEPGHKYPKALDVKLVDSVRMTG